MRGQRSPSVAAPITPAANFTKRTKKGRKKRRKDEKKGLSVATLKRKKEKNKLRIKNEKKGPSVATIITPAANFTKRKKRKRN